MDNDENFCVTNNVTYPPFKNGLYMEEYFLDYMTKKCLEFDKNGRRYIPCLWTNFQIQSWFQERREAMQKLLDNYIIENPNEKGYFTVVQHDDGPMLKLPPNTVIYGACSGTVPLPLIYQDIEHKLENLSSKKSFQEKSVFCSFVGSLTHNVRNTCFETYRNNPLFKFHLTNKWTDNVNVDNQRIFIDFTVNSKFVLAPRGYGRSSFRFFEILQLGSIPVYIWSDKEWLPYTEQVDYDKFCISIHESDIDFLDTLLSNITERQYNTMLKEYQKVKHMFELDYMCKYIAGEGFETISGIKNAFIPHDPKPINISLSPEPSVLLVAISIGEKYLQTYNQLFRKSHENYAKKHGYDFEVLSDYIDNRGKEDRMSLYYQKMLVCSKVWTKSYDYIVYVDSDILININSPAIHLAYDFKDKIGIVDEYSQPTKDIRIKIQKQLGWETSAKDYYKLCGFDLDTEMVLNSGVLVMQPKWHKSFLENIYNTHLPKSKTHNRGPHYEQTSLGYELQKRGNYLVMSNRWNTIWTFYKLCDVSLPYIFDENHFIHFAGNIDFDLIPELIRSKNTSLK